MAIAMSIMVFGYDSSFIGNLLAVDSFKRDFGLDGVSTKEKNDTTSNLISVYSAGAFWGSVFMLFPLDYLGRKSSLAGSNALFVLGAILSTAANGNLGMMYAGRVICGFGIGGAVSVAPTYISELSPPAIRGRMTGLFESFYQVGSLVGFWINFGIDQTIDTKKSIAWQIPMAVQLIPPGIVLLAIPWLRESPTWLLKKDRDEEALKVYSYIRNLPESHPYLHEDIAFVKAQIELERAITTDNSRRASFIEYLRCVCKESVQKGVRNRFLLVIMITMWQPWCGAVAVNYYSPTIFRSIGLYNTTLWTGIYGVIKAGASIIYFTVFIDRFGRKWPWIVSCVGCSVCMYYLAGYVSLAYPVQGVPETASEVAAGKGATAAILLFGFMWSFGANGLPLVIASEIFPPSLRSVAGPFASLNVWLWSFVTTKTLPYMYTSMGYGIYVFFGCVLICAAIYAFFYIHETKGLRIDQMDELFGGVGGQKIDYEKEVTEVEHKENVHTMK
ncbi:hypothetical protein PFICI_02464 [Pestalotiopsis fici W106-1]|uniref:Major facilitator superfamily (MFS) profile domain-containing protein n=1 Tax=Pestalotiopsis fici (strain W106-1 / CGMCC3.15140) TaxID=1229662 RepID=W3XEJ5_PESFW|nr:uncharacterized protein PFICI_02464 [Pestalotiopsis fici W106-1]ETS84439.1 hypothetical protein PFICI_02464 [Pestalotiopsis fici W106-1]